MLKTGKGDKCSHKIVDRHASYTAKPGFHVAQADVEVLPNPFQRDGTWDVHVEQVVCRDAHVLAAHEKLVRRRHVLVEDLGGDGGKCRVRYPGAFSQGWVSSEACNE